MALLFLLLCGVSLSDGFNIDVQNPAFFFGNKEELFGYTLLQYQSDNTKQIIISAPLGANRTGTIFKCSVETGNCSHLYQPDMKEIRFFGMSIALRTSPSATLTCCSPSFNHECDGNSYLNGICYQFNDKFNIIRSIRTAFQECTKNKVDMVFLFDGSASMTTDDFNKNKNFIWDVMTNLKNSSIKFAAVQFSWTFSTVFTFKDYVTNTAKKKLFAEEHMKSLTNTHNAINFTINHLLYNVESGADPEATKALVIITDGSPTDLETNEIQRCEELNIKRFVIGVGNKVILDNLRSLVSEPENIFMIANYNGLNGLLGQLQNKIYSIEGAQGKIFREELSQSGFSVASDKDSLILGAVGLNNWRGMVYEATESKTGITETKIIDKNLNENSYNGYTVVVGQKDKQSLVFSGAPRSNHWGQVTMFRKTTEWEAVRTISGEQIGSYFGGSQCVLDLDSDNNIDFLVVGAPLYFQSHPQKEGRIYIYRLTETLELNNKLNVCESAQGRFGMTLAAIADLNGDQLQDLAVGAPLEDNQKGAIYIYLGNREHGIHHQYSQRILASSISENLQHFGLAIHGVMDMGQDGLTDIAVGARGTVLLFETWPVVSISTQLRFDPSEISLNDFDCSQDKVFPAFNLTTCLTMTENTKSKGVKTGLNVSMQIKADAVRQDSRAFFMVDGKKSRSLVMSVLLDLNRLCYNHKVHMRSCVKDTLSPILFHLTLKQSDHQPQNLKSILNINSKTTADVQVPFEINCKNKSCISDLQLDFKFLNSSLLVVDQDFFRIRVTLVNKGDDSFNTSVVLLYPPGLSLSKFNALQANRRTLTSCGDRDEGALNKTTCSISLPVYRKNTHAVFEGVFRISFFYDWADSLQMTLVASSDNSRNKTSTTVMKTLPVLYSVDVIIRPVPENSVTFLDFTLEDKGPKPITVLYKVSNLGLKGLPVTVQFWMPSQTNVSFHQLWNHTIYIQKNMTTCDITPPEKSAECPSEQCVKFVCQSFILNSRSDVQFELRALMTFPNKQQYTGKWSFSEFKNEDDFSVSAQLDFDKKRYHQRSTVNDSSIFHRAKIIVKTELIIPPDMILIIVTGGGSGLLLLIIIIILLLKCGFFKRKHHPLCEEEYDVCSADTNGYTAETPSLSEEKQFLSTDVDSGNKDTEK